MTELKDATAALTGAASGIGRALAYALAERGCHLALADRDEVVDDDSNPGALRQKPWN